MSERDHLESASLPHYWTTSSPGLGTTEPEPGRFFPFEPLRFVGILVPSAYKLLPSWLKVVQSVPHLVLLVGYLANFCILVIACIKLLNDAPAIIRSLRLLETLLLVFDVLFASLCGSQFLNELQQYKADWLTQSWEIQQGQEDLGKQMNLMCSEIKSLINQSMSTQAALAESNMESKRRDFVRFLQKIAPKLRRESCESLLVSFRELVLLWLHVFEECSIKPRTHPFIVTTEEDIQDNCGTAAEVAEFVSDRIKTQEVQILEQEVKTTKQHLARESKSFRARMRRLFRLPLVFRFNILGKRARSQDVESQSKDNWDFDPYLRSSFTSELTDQHSDPCWFVFGNVGFGTERVNDETEEDEEDEDEADLSIFPVKFKCGCFAVTVLSSDHARFLLSLVLALVLLGLSFFFAKSNNDYESCMQALMSEMTAAMAICVLCIVFVLYDFLEIDKVQRLQVQIRELQMAAGRVEQRRQRIVLILEEANNIADLWTERTLPRLELMKELGEELQDASDLDLVPVLSNIVTNVSMLEKALPSLETWLNDLKESDKKRLVAILGNICSEEGTAMFMLKYMPGPDSTNDSPEALLQELAKSWNAAPEQPK
eukprot:TRINITY_DN2602_c0_g1_i1.p1 TRINITY_DN2602_c0_g1~~TRINITY_DN2602_c0_g1_i1.p1  ORF type:complete len:601 (+),score=88.44 TRINITY_DN2602_c0_g1_i1:109-1911(+)